MKNKKLFVSGLDYAVTEEDLRNVFKVFGEITYLKIMKDRETGKSRGFGFIEFARYEDAQEAKKKLEGTVIGKRKIYINEARPLDQKRD